MMDGEISNDALSVAKYFSTNEQRFLPEKEFPYLPELIYQILALHQGNVAEDPRPSIDMKVRQADPDCFPPIFHQPKDWIVSALNETMLNIYPSCCSNSPEVRFQKVHE